MKAEMDSNGTFVIEAETALEAVYLSLWSEEFMMKYTRRTTVRPDSSVKQQFQGLGNFLTKGVTS